MTKLRGEFPPRSAGGAAHLTKGTQPLKAITERVTLERAAYLGGDAEIDFYFISPVDVHAEITHSKKGNAVTPILTVALSSRNLCALLIEAKAELDRLGILGEVL
ncbi:MAG: hypothetical protein IT350_08955 [Deltaproteobacteria bacterium]|nr:hypothetical protein [Deltaproteobacteria bacterium]